MKALTDRSWQGTERRGDEDGADRRSDLIEVVDRTCGIGRALSDPALVDRTFETGGRRLAGGAEGQRPVGRAEVAAVRRGDARRRMTFETSRSQHTRPGGPGTVRGRPGRLPVPHRLSGPSVLSSPELMTYSGTPARPSLALALLLALPAPAARATGQRRSRQDAAGLRRGQRVVPGAARRADVPELPGVPEEAVRLRARRPTSACCCSTCRTPATPAATSVPRNALTVQIAPLRYAFETIPSNERMNAIMNHELVHVVTMDQAAGHDRFFRRLFGGKVMPVAEQPESVLYFYLTTPRVAAPRWFHEGSAVFVDTWMAGGIGRAQGGFDEMVFRAMVRDNAPFYDPLGAGLRGHEDRLPAADQLVSLRHAVPDLAGAHLLARAGAGLDGAQAGQPRLLRHAVPPRLRPVAGKRVGRLDRRREGVPAEEPRGHPPVSDHAAPATSRRARWARCRAPTTTGARPDLRRLQLPRRGRARRRARREDRRGRADRAAEGADDLHRRVAGLRPARRHPLLHHRQRRLSRPGPPGSRRPARPRCCRRTRASASSPSTRPIDRSGASAISTACAPSSGCRRRTRSGRGS